MGPKIFDLNFFLTQKFFLQILFWSKTNSDQIFLTPKKMSNQFFLPKKNFLPNFFGPKKFPTKFFFYQIFFRPTFFLPNFFFRPTFWQPNFFVPKIFSDQIFFFWGGGGGISALGVSPKWVKSRRRKRMRERKSVITMANYALHISSCYAKILTEVGQVFLLVICNLLFVWCTQLIISDMHSTWHMQAAKAILIYLGSICTIWYWFRQLPWKHTFGILADVRINPEADIRPGGQSNEQEIQFYPILM